MASPLRPSLDREQPPELRFGGIGHIASPLAEGDGMHVAHRLQGANDGFADLAAGRGRERMACLHELNIAGTRDTGNYNDGSVLP